LGFQHQFQQIYDKSQNISAQANKFQHPSLVLMQEDDQEKDRVICYEAKTLLPAEKNYPTTEKECLVIMWAM